MVFTQRPQYAYDSSELVDTDTVRFIFIFHLLSLSLFNALHMCVDCVVCTLTVQQRYYIIFVRAESSGEERRGQECAHCI